ncbi:MULTISPECIES: DUF6702 family protein [Weeksella]|uniref:DUF4251 domain-containing protein n=1 Tax=Weeksella virosa (strain ATCC 43766 / DSM 16922 / JCM 21250 / CCUG 30538 / CDC 9751 / IAM 14551 / NBRC 16016 / NCTC 11634 / CL345/78) TaxID=865938 RepID=F0NXH3_WEEVC|nr:MULTISPECIES: DUF6702 family protein [Weeksella]ADX67963.1 hypothetical protein Weevi_1259 [Weeksella virosa DSM 16922]MDK7374269.1 hypothetical protein [Weeksella virosa]MDK7674572.1 hypothetical protein [Weeksella virosa]OFM86126.1 hypothetical protein HMPREF2660_06315 [Weeksella sp. HMSC059D05]SUP54271.1 Uncharacterised protein [Weeksella virosa]
MKALYKIFIFFSLFGFYKTVQAQNFHSSTTKVEYDHQSSVLNVTSRFLTNDLEQVVGEKISNKANFESKLKSYIGNRMVLSVNGVTLGVSYIGFQTNDKMTRVYLKAENVSKPTSISLKMTMLTDVFADQQNMISFDISGVRKSFTTSRGNETASLKL